LAIGLYNSLYYRTNCYEQSHRGTNPASVE